ILILHSWLRWAVVITALWTILRAIKGISGKTPYMPADNKSNLFFMISCDLQFLIGIILYFAEGWSANWTGGRLREVMHNSAERFFTLEHVVLMLIALIIVHIGRAVVKKAATSQEKHKKTLIYFGVAILLILLAIPWPFRHALGAHPLFRL
ncbi:MAG TPA: hypothetical protein VIU45_04945, partial [Chitinophagaceae bacterium]